MAIPDLIPEAADLVTLKEASALLVATDHPASPSTLRRWFAEHGRPIHRHGRTDYVERDDLWSVHRDEVLAR